MIDESYTEEEVRTIAQKLLAAISPTEGGATVIGLSGDLGAGKTTITKEIALLLGVKEVVQSPTFVVAKFYDAQHYDFSELVHVDAYRIDSTDELLPLGFETILAQPRTLVVVEWPERIKDALPQRTHYFHIAHDDTRRIIKHTQSHV